MKTIYKTLNDKPLIVEISHAASKAMKKLSHPLAVEMQLYFGCLIRKQVHFSSDGQAENIGSNDDGLSLSFRFVTSQTCSIDEIKNQSTMQDFPMKNPARFSPNWLRIGYHKGDWSGEFGYR